MAEQAVRVGFNIGAFGNFHELAREVGELMFESEAVRSEFGDAHFHVQTMLFPRHAAFIEALAELVDGNVPLAYAVVIGAAGRYFAEALPTGEAEDFGKAVAWVLSSILDESGPPPVSRDDVH